MRLWASLQLWEVQTICWTSTVAAEFLMFELAGTIEAIVTLRILIADDSRMVRHSLHALLEQHPGWTVCSEAVDGADAVAKAQECNPDIMVLDFFMPGMTGVEAAGVLHHLLPSVPILIVTLYITAQLITQAKRVGIKGAVPKSDIRQMISGVEAVANHREFFKETEQ